MNCFRPVVTALLPELVRSPGELVSANAANGFVEGTSSLVGPVVGSLVGAVFGVPALLVVTAVVMVGVAGVAGRLPSVTIGRRHSGTAEAVISPTTSPADASSPPTVLPASSRCLAPRRRSSAVR